MRNPQLHRTAPRPHPAPLLPQARTIFAEEQKRWASRRVIRPQLPRLLCSGLGVRLGLKTRKFLNAPPASLPGAHLRRRRSTFTATLMQATVTPVWSARRRAAPGRPAAAPSSRAAARRGSHPWGCASRAPGPPPLVSARDGLQSRGGAEAAATARRVGGAMGGGLFPDLVPQRQPGRGGRRLQPNIVPDAAGVWLTRCRGASGRRACPLRAPAEEGACQDQRQDRPEEERQREGEKPRTELAEKE